MLRCRELRTVLTVFLTTGALAACASAPTEDPDALTACFVIDNTEAAGPVGQVFLVSSTNERTRLGEVPMGRTLRRCVSRSNWTVSYRFVAEQAPADRMDPALNMTQPDVRESERFYIEPGFDVVWEVDRNVVRMVETDERGSGS